MATRGPTKGSRITVKLPFGRTVTGKNPKGQYVQVKQGVADKLKFTAVKTLPTKQISVKTVQGEKKYTRLISSGSYRQRSVKLIFKKPQAIKGSKGTFKTVSLPLASGCTINDVVQYFKKQTALGVIALVTPDGKRIQWDFSS